MSIVLIRALALAGVVALVAPAVTRAQVPPPPPPPVQTAPGMPRDAAGAAPQTGTARLSGRVTSLETGRPIRRAIVRAIAPEIRDGKSVSTDADGRWELRDLPAARYTLTINKGGYVTLSYGQQRPFESGKPVEVGNGGRVEKLDVALPRGGAVTGRVVDEFGEPVVGASVSPMRYRYLGGQRQLANVGSSDSTDDLGQYRLHGLPPGDYFIAARPGTFVSLFGTSDDRTGYGQTFYPGAPSVNEATRVTIAVGQEAQNIVVSLMPSRIANLSGTLTTSSGKPVKQGIVMMRPVDGAMLMGAIRPGMVLDGKWTISGVTPGEYDLTAQAMDLEAIAQSGSTVGAAGAEYATERITVTGEDRAAIAIVTEAGARVKGAIRFEGAEPPAAPQAMASVMALSAVPGGLSMGGSGRIKADWTFELQGVVGRRLVRVGGLPPGWTMKSATLNGTDITDSGFEAKSGSEITGLEILATRNATELSGTVQTAKGTTVSDYVLIVFPPEAERWGYQSRYVRAVRPDQSGRFLVPGLPPGSYLAIALDYAEPGQETDSEFLERLKAQATPVRLGEAEKKTITLKVSGT